MNEVPRRQSAGCRSPPDVGAEIEEVFEEVFEGEIEDGVELDLEIESVFASVRRSLWFADDRSVLRFNSMTAPNFFRGTFCKPRS